MKKINLTSLRIALATLAISAGALQEAAAVPAILTNGSFASNGGAGQLTVNTTLANWTGGGKEGTFGGQTTPPVFVFTPGTATQLSSTGVAGDGFMGTVKYYGATAAPDGGVVIGMDGDPQWGGSISQTVTGLTLGQVYHLTFSWAGAQQQGFSGNTTEAFQVTFGSQTLSTTTVSTPSQTFVGWQSAALNFTATASSQALTFLANGSPSGEPPWLLLDGVSMTQVVPEPASLAMFAIGGLGLAMAYRRRRQRRS